MKNLLFYLKVWQLVQVYLTGLGFINKDLKAELAKEKRSVFEKRKKLAISELLKILSKENLGLFKKEGVGLFKGVSRIDLRLGGIEKIPFEIQPTPHADVSGLKQFYGTFYTQYGKEKNIRFEVFVSLILSGIDPWNERVVIVIEKDYPGPRYYRVFVSSHV